MDRILALTYLSKRQIFVASVLLLSSGIFVSEFLSGRPLLLVALALSVLASFLFYFATREDINIGSSLAIFVLPFFYTLAFALFYPLLPARILTHLIMTFLYAFGLYSLFLTQNIFVVSTIRTINLLRSARIVSFVLTIIVLFLLTNVIFSERLPFYISSFFIFIASFLLAFQSIWTYSLSRAESLETIALPLILAFAVAELSLILNIWPVNAAIYSIFVTGIFYSYSGLVHAWVEKRLFRNVLWEYVWVGFLAVLILIFFTKWGI